jgi:molecular chaperone GrpE
MLAKSGIPAVRMWHAGCLTGIRATNFQAMTKHQRPHPPARQPDPIADAAGDDSAPVDSTSGEPTDHSRASAFDAPDAANTDSRLAELENQLAAQQDKFLRLAAEYDNFRKRSVRERLDAELRGMGLLIRGILDPLDDIGRFAHVDPQTTEATTLQQGVEMVEKKLLKSLAGHGLEIVNPGGQPFDPALHEAVSTVPAGSVEEDHLIAQVYQVGYIFNGQLLRAARVVVKQWKGLPDGVGTE